jgi:hypothetical protein
VDRAAAVLVLRETRRAAVRDDQVIPRPRDKDDVMTRGKCAAKAEKRREDSALEEIRTLKAQLQAERDGRRMETEELKTQVVKLRGEIMREAAALADKKVADRLEQIAAERRKRDVTEEMAVTLINQHDYFIREACRYISMTTGCEPVQALAVVWSWMDGKDVYAVSAKDLMERGVTPSGWVALMLRMRSEGLQAYKNSRRVRRERGKEIAPMAVSLDHAEERAEEFNIHPGYRKWKQYYRDVTPEEIEWLAKLAQEDLT